MARTNHDRATAFRFTDGPGFKLKDKLHDEDYQTFVPILEAAIAAHGKIRILVQFENFHKVERVKWRGSGLVFCTIYKTPFS